MNNHNFNYIAPISHQRNQKPASNKSGSDASMPPPSRPKVDFVAGLIYQGKKFERQQNSHRFNNSSFPKNLQDKKFYGGGGPRPRSEFNNRNFKQRDNSFSNQSNSNQFKPQNNSYSKFNNYRGGNNFNQNQSYEGKPNYNRQFKSVDQTPNIKSDFTKTINKPVEPTGDVDLEDLKLTHQAQILQGQQGAQSLQRQLPSINDSFSGKLKPSSTPASKNYERSTVNRNAIIWVNERQQLNPALKHVNFKYSLTNIIKEDFLMNQQQLSVIFLSLEYHIEYPLYLKWRLSEVRNYYIDIEKNQQIILILLVDDQRDSFEQFITQINIDCLKYSATLICAFSFQEVSNYLNVYKQFQAYDQKYLRENTKKLSHSQLATDAITSIRGINKNDAQKLFRKYGTVQEIVLAKDYSRFLELDGIGKTKVDRLINCFRGKFNIN
ncbi:Excision repair enzyme ERCC-1 [Oxytricha trifallax]|uniref:Excision repair enzyme ERCC-1 n=1 Tax=Oxytricha trifallax TaxID=1172189 RepID=A0A073ICL2_9SPIT|nr:Excision repair enzyme ERCC-1 [Oxytricha trifallax]